MPYLSVLIPVYNGQAYLASSIESALGQPCQDLEVVIANDGSTDGSLEIAQAYAERDSRVRVLSHENCGPGMTRNLAMPELRGAWTLFLDCDDIILPGFYTEQLRAFLAECAGSDVETIVPARLFGDVSLERVTFEPVPFDEVFGRGSEASWRIDHEFATLLYSTEMLRREHIEFGVTRPAEMESIFRHKAVFCSTRAMFTNSLWFAVRRDNPGQATRASNWNTLHVDEIRYDAYGELVEWQWAHNASKPIIEETERRRQAAADAIARAKKIRFPWQKRAARKASQAEREAWLAWRAEVEQPLGELILTAEQQAVQIAKARALLA